MHTRVRHHGQRYAGLKKQFALLLAERERLERRLGFIDAVRSGRVPGLECLRIGSAEARALGLPAEAPYAPRSDASSDGALPLHLPAAQALAVTDPLVLCKKVAGGALLGSASQGARRHWEMGVEASVRHLPVLSLRELPDAAWVIR